jgi:hypothetical protein
VELPLRLRPDGDRRGEVADSEAGHECPSVHHSIT